MKLEMDTRRIGHSHFRGDTPAVIPLQGNSSTIISTTMAVLVSANSDL